MGEGGERDRLTFWQRQALRGVHKRAKKAMDEPLTSDDWAAFFETESSLGERLLSRALRALPSSPRCGVCGAPFAGVGGRLLRPLGYRPSRKSPNLCAVCVEASPPGGTTTDAGVLFADVRGFTRLSEQSDPETVSELLRRFYAAAEDVIFPEAIIDKLIGDEVMALYLPMYGNFDRAAPLMVDHARALLRKVGYGGEDGPFVEVGIGLDYGEAYVGNVGRRWLNDFTAVGDVVNVASRLQGEAAGGEIIASGRLVDQLGETPGERLDLTLKGKAEQVVAYRVPL
ncbi:MAG TPA: adenylate/guanylate cyclase domain-containing protein [Solirubrobacterales bacterium]